MKVLFSRLLYFNQNSNVTLSISAVRHLSTGKTVGRNWFFAWLATVGKEGGDLERNSAVVRESADEEDRDA